MAGFTAKQSCLSVPRCLRDVLGGCILLSLHCDVHCSTLCALHRVHGPLHVLLGCQSGLRSGMQRQDPLTSLVLPKGWQHVPHGMRRAPLNP